MSPSPYELPPADALPEQKGLPDPFLGPDGKRIQSVAEWPVQRDYLKALLCHYTYGHTPPRPTAEEMSIRQVMARPAFDGQAVEEHLVLTIQHAGQTFDIDLWLFRPQAEGRHPTIVKNCHSLFDGQTGYGKWAENIVEPGASKTIENDTHAARQAVERGYLLCKFNREQLAIDEGYGRRCQLANLELPSHRNVGIYPLYPDCDWSAIAVWAWAHSVVLDALDRLGYTDMEKTVATGHSRGGWTATLAGIFDERIALVVANGGFNLIRIRDPQGARPTGDFIAAMETKSPHFHHPRFYTFADQKYRLPFDIHTACSTSGSIRIIRRRFPGGCLPAVTTKFEAESVRPMYRQTKGN
ncbi:MAG: hypothetical protein GKR89_23360 [Candidatus Latescibacteria bacterium]|nr:hypothetical protein [Candidatus Latescibacterota bacterium]